MLQVGDAAPNFAARSQHGSLVRLSDYRGSKVALYFYPRDNTPGCTKQSCNLRDHVTVLASHGITVLGISGDSVESHEKFAQKYRLPFLLLADTDKTIVNEYGVWGEKKMYGRTFLGIKRTTFFIDEEGVIQHIFKRPKVLQHAEEILKVSQS